MIKIVKKIGCEINKVVNTPLVKKESCINSATAVYFRIECGLNAFICGHGEMRKIP